MKPGLHTDAGCGLVNLLKAYSVKVELLQHFLFFFITYVTALHTCLGAIN